MMRCVLIYLFVFGGVSCFLNTGDAEACSPLMCRAPTLMPGEREVIPSSTPALYLYSDDIHVLLSSDNIVLFNEDKMEEVPIVFESQTHRAAIIRPTVLEDSTRYSLIIGADHTVCYWTKKDAFYSFETSTALALPDAALRLNVASATHENVSLPATDGSCSKFYDGARLVLRAEVPKSLQPWRPMLLWQTLIDGQLYTIQPTDDGEVVLEAVCDWFAPDATNHAIGEGVFDVQMVATLVGTQTQWSSQMMTVRVSCAEGPWSGHGDVGGGCGCRQVHGESPHWVMVLLIVLGLFWRRQRVD